MLPSKNRLSRRDFTSSSRSGRTQSFSLFSLSTGPAKAFKASVVVSKKVEPRAFGRNLLRRRYYAAIEGFKAHPPRALIFYVRKESQKASFEEISLAVRKVFSSLPNN